MSESLIDFDAEIKRTIMITSKLRADWPHEIEYRKLDGLFDQETRVARSITPVLFPRKWRRYCELVDELFLLYLSAIPTERGGAT